MRGWKERWRGGGGGKWEMRRREDRSWKYVWEGGRWDECINWGIRGSMERTYKWRHGKEASNVDAANTVSFQRSAESNLNQKEEDNMKNKRLQESRGRWGMNNSRRAMKKYKDGSKEWGRADCTFQLYWLQDVNSHSQSLISVGVQRNELYLCKNIQTNMLKTKPVFELVLAFGLHLNRGKKYQLEKWNCCWGPWP